MKYNKGRLNDFNVYPRQPRCPAARAAGLRSAASRACGLHPPTRPRAGGRAAAELVAGLVAWLAGQGQRHGAIKLQLHVRRAGPPAAAAAAARAERGGAAGGGGGASSHRRCGHVGAPYFVSLVILHTK
jgi:hypothetical protein